MLTKTLSLTQILFLASWSLFAQSPKEQITAEAMRILKENLDELDYSSCLKQSRSELESSFRTGIESFFKEEGTMEYIREEMEYNGSEARYMLGEEAYGFAEYDVIERSGVDEDAFYDCQANLTQRLYEENEENTEAMLTQAFAVSEEDIDVGLPVYANSSLISYFDRQQSTEMLKQLYPKVQGQFPHAAIYASHEDFNDIVAFYADQLKGFHQGRVNDNAVAFSTEDFDFNSLLSIEGASAWALLESVWIEKLDYPMPDGDVKIEIHWK